jgi:hypothetical protein
MSNAYGQVLNAVSECERRLLEIALGVLRSDTDWADFLCSWLNDYGRQVISHKMPPLMDEPLHESEPVVADAHYYRN